LVIGRSRILKLNDPGMPIAAGTAAKSMQS
jgi:hypothetical protein